MKYVINASFLYLAAGLVVFCGYLIREWIRGERAWARIVSASTEQHNEDEKPARAMAVVAQHVHDEASERAKFASVRPMPVSIPLSRDYLMSLALEMAPHLGVSVRSPLLGECPALPFERRPAVRNWGAN